MNLWILDPKTKEPSVSLTMLVVTFVGALGASALQMAGKIDNVGMAAELFYGNVALYFGRRFSVGKVTASSSAPEASEKSE